MTKIDFNSSIPLAILSIGNIGCSFLLQIIMFSIIGVSKDTDLFIFVSTVPLLISSVLTGILNNVLLPYFSTLSKLELDNVIKEIFFVVFFFSLTITFIVFFLLYFIFKISYFSSFLESEELVFEILTLQSIAMFLSILYSVIWAYLNSLGYHFKSEFIPFLITFSSIPTAYFILPTYGVSVIALLLVIKFLLSILLQIHYLDFEKKIGWSNTIFMFHYLWGKIKPIFFSSIYYKSDLIVERFLLMNSPSGSLSVLNLSQQLMNAVIQVLTKAYNTPVIKNLSKTYSFNRGCYIKDFNKSLLMLSFFIIVLMSILFFFPKIFYYLFYFSDNLKLVSDDIWFFLCLLSGVLFSNCLASLVNASFYISGDTSTPSKVSSLIFTLFLPLKIVIYNLYGIKAMVFCTSIYCLVNLVFLMYFHKKKVLDKC